MSSDSFNSTISSSKSFSFRFLSGLQTVYAGPIRSLTFYRAGDNTQITILPHHAPLATVLAPKIFFFVLLNGQKRSFQVTNGTFLMQNNQATLTTLAHKSA